MECRLSDHDEDTLAHAPQIGPSPLHDLINVTLILLMEYRERINSILDLAAGDGRLLATLPDNITAWGYDSDPANMATAAAKYGVEVRGWDPSANGIIWADLTIAAECLERMQNPHAMVRRISRNSEFIIASSPAYETPETHSTGHIWCWDMNGYEAMFNAAGYRTLRHVLDIEGLGTQVFVGRRT